MKWSLLIAGSLAATVLTSAQTLVWQDNFDGTEINTNHWTFDIGNGTDGWGNHELEYYTSRPENAYVSNGLLNIVARQESFNGFNYTSARLKTQGLFFKKYGRFEFRARFPSGQGYWGALWLWPADSVYGAWAASGEIDIVEFLGDNFNRIYEALHYGGTSPSNQYVLTSYTLDLPATDFHTYALEWTTNAISWFVDGQPFQTLTNWYTQGYPYPAPYDQPFYILMNLAVGGDFPHSPDGTTPFPGVMQVDYVRVYDFTAPPLRIDSIEVSENNVKLIGTGPAGMSYYLLASTDPTLPRSDWAMISTNRFSDVGTFTNTVNTFSTGVYYQVQTF